MEELTGELTDDEDSFNPLPSSCFDKPPNDIMSKGGVSPKKQAPKKRYVKKSAIKNCNKTNDILEKVADKNVIKDAKCEASKPPANLQTERPQSDGIDLETKHPNGTPADNEKSYNCLPSSCFEPPPKLEVIDRSIQSELEEKVSTRGANEQERTEKKSGKKSTNCSTNKKTNHL